MIRLIPLETVSEVMAVSRATLWKIAADQGRPESERRFPRHTHERFPQFIKDGRRWKVIEHEFRALMERRAAAWTTAN